MAIPIRRDAGSVAEGSELASVTGARPAEKRR
jgi:hypothetical protein